MPRIIVLAAVARNHVIGRDNQLAWHLPEDLQHFKGLTLGHTVLMGRKTWESLPARFRPLPGRRNIVVTRQAHYVADGADIAASLPSALALTSENDRVFVIGGAEIYEQALPLADAMELTEVDLEPEGDAWFPAFSGGDWRETARQAGVSQNGIAYAFVTYQRIRQEN